METGRRYMGYRVPFWFLLDLIQEGKETNAKCLKGVPMDAKFITSYEEYQSASVVVVFEHPSFPLTDFGCVFPYGELVFGKGE